jgi:hypothetical protein
MSVIPALGNKSNSFLLHNFNLFPKQDPDPYRYKKNG